jgi:hypothetical protein
MVRASGGAGIAVRVGHAPAIRSTIRSTPCSNAQDEQHWLDVLGMVITGHGVVEGIPRVLPRRDGGAPRALVFALAHELGRHGVTAVALTPGFMRPGILEGFGVTAARWNGGIQTGARYGRSTASTTSRAEVPTSPCSTRPSSGAKATFLAPMMPAVRHVTAA